MGKGFLDALLAPLQAKDYITNEVRDEDGIRYYKPMGAPFFDKRSITLSFVIVGENTQDFYAKQRAFLDTIYEGNIVLSVPAWSTERFKLLYTGQSCTWNMNKARNLATITLKFDEPNPKDRG